MGTLIFDHRFLILRRLVQLSVAVLFMAAHYWGLVVLSGNYSSATLMGKIHLADPFAVLQMLLAGYIAGSATFIGALIILLLYAVLFGRAFCSWVCPINAFNNLAAFIGRKSNDNKLLSAAIPRHTRIIVMVVALAVSITSSIAAFEMINPVNMLANAIIFGIGGSWATLAALFIVETFVVKNLWCGRICPIGAFYALTGKFRLIRIQHQADNCTKCNACFKVCPEKQVLDIISIKSGSINNAACTNCCRCVEVCKDNALAIGLKLKKER